MAEKLLKSLLTKSGSSIPKIHDLVDLETRMMKQSPDIRKLHKELVLLGRYYIASRYPTDVPGGFTWEQAEEAYSAAKNVKSFVLGKL